jgi:sodium/proline symporter
MILAIFVIYLLVLVAIGLYCTRYNKDIGDFVLGGRRLGPWVAAFSAQASDFSGWLLIGLPGAAYVAGLSLTWACIGCAAGVMFNWLVLAPRLRQLTEQYGAITIPDFLEARFQDRTRLIRIIAVATILTFYVTYVSAQFIAAGSVFQAVFHETRMPWGELDWLSYYHQGLLIGAAIILLYTTFGGFMAVCWTDFLQAIMMVVAAILLPVVAIWKLGGFGGLWEAMSAAPPADEAYASLTVGQDVLNVGGGQIGASLAFGVVIAGLAWGLGYPGQPHIICRFMAIREPRKLPKSALIAVVWTLLDVHRVDGPRHARPGAYRKSKRPGHAHAGGALAAWRGGRDGPLGGRGGDDEHRGLADHRGGLGGGS